MSLYDAGPFPDLSHLEFSPDIFSGPGPPGTTDTTSDTDLLLHSLLTAEILSLPPPGPSPSTPLPPHSSVPEAPPPDIDDPFLVKFADLDGLLKDSALFENPSSPSTCSDSAPDIFVFPLQERDTDPLLLDLSECLSLCSPSLSPYSETPPTPLSGSPALSSPPSSVLHDHTYTSSLLPTDATTDVPRRKRKSSFSDSLLSPDSTHSDAPPPIHKKKTSAARRDTKYQARREKNNVASQVSRTKRRARHRDLFSRVEELESANAELREKAREMEAEAEAMRKALVHKLSK